MKIPVRRSCISLIVLSALVEAIRANENDTSTAEGRQGRVSGRIVKLYSGYKPDPFLCIEEGFKADPVQCSVFYRCLKSSSGKFTVFKFQCGPGTVYDPETEVCNHPRSTKRSECGGIKSTKKKVEQENENDIDQHELPSPISTIIPIYTTSAKNNTEYTSSSGVPSIENGYMHYLTTSSTPYHMGSTSEKVQDITHNQVTHLWTDNKNTIQSEITSSTTIFPVLEKNQPCTLDGFMGDRENCKKFYRCVSNLRGGFIRYEFLCSEPTVWDDHMQSCNHPWAVRSRRCGLAGISNENNTQISHLSNNISTEQIGESYGINLPETLNQDNNDLSIQKQPPATYENRLYNEDEYNLENNKISYGPSLINDKNIGNQENAQRDELHFGQKINIQSTYSTNKLEENSVTPHTEIRQNFICTQSGFVGDYTDCKKFYRCVENGKGSFTKYEFTCSQGTVWDKKLEACNYAWAVKECGGASTGDSLITAGNLSSSTSASPTILNENVDNGYINHSGQQNESPSTVTIRTPVILISTTAASNQKVAECTETGFVGDKNDCKKFYRCVDNGRGTFTKYEYKCGDGTLWDQNIEACNHAWAVQSCNSLSSNDSIHTTSEAAIKTHGTTFLIQSTTTEKLDNSNDYNNPYGPQLDAVPQNPEIDLHKTTLTPIINKKNDCDTLGFRGDSNDCKKFYRCVDNGQRGFIKYEFSCGEGTVWDPEIEACNHAWAVKHCGISVPLKNEVTSDSIENTHSSPNTHDLEVTTAISSMKPATQQNESSDYDSGYGQQPSESTKVPYVELETTTIKQTLGQKNNSCQTTGFIGDINNCNKFYRCVDNGNGGFIRHEFSCGEGTVWDPEIEACNHVWAVKHCGGSITSTENLLTSSSTHVNIVESGYVTNNNYIDSHSNSENVGETTTLLSSTSTLTTVTNTRNECKSSGFMGDKSDCQKFYRCVDNGNGVFIRHEFMCGEGTVWDSRIEACNHKWAVEKCGGDSHNEFVETTTISLQPTITVTESVPTSTLSVITSSPTISTTITTKPILPSHEDRECNSDGYFANPDDCNKFYRCVNEGIDEYTKYEFSCAEGTAWDVKIQSCNYVSQVEACHLNQHIINTTDTKPVHEPIHDEQIMESVTTKSTTSASTTSTSTTSSSTTSSSTTSSSTTPASTTSASTTFASTTSAYTSKNPKPAGENTCKDEGYFGDTNDCKKFYRCVYESNEVYTKYDFTCGDGTIWDQDIIACNHPRDVKNPSCKSESESTSSISTSSTTTDNNVTPPSSTTNKPSTSNVATSNNDTNSNCNNNTNENTTSQNFTCSKAGFYADPSDCKKFYRCVDWENNGKKFSIYHFDCADGTIWDPALETCNHADSVYPPRNCNNTQGQNENTSETSSTTEPITTTTQQTESTTTSSEPCKTTTQSTTTGEYSSTKTTQSSTTDGSTTQSSTTEESSTQSSTTEESTTQKFTTQSSTTEESTTQSTTQSQTPEESTTQTSTTQSSTTEESTTQPSTTPSSTTEESTIHSSTTEESTTKSSTTEESTTHSSTTEESTTQSSTTKEPATEESTTSTTNEQTTSTTQMMTSATDQTSTTTEPSTTTAEGSSSSITESTQESTTESSSKKECPDTADDQQLYVCPTSFKRHPKYCNLFYQCTEDKDSYELKIAVFRCPNNTIYDENKIQCLADNKSSNKCNGQISQKTSPKQLGATQIDPFMVTKESMACQKSGHFPFEKNTECSSSLLKCELTKSGTLRGFVYRCPDGFVYWNISRRCEPIRKVRDCKGSSYSWKRRYDIPLEKFNIAS